VPTLLQDICSDLGEPPPVELARDPLELEQLGVGSVLEDRTNRVRPGLLLGCGCRLAFSGEGFLSIQEGSAALPHFVRDLEPLSALLGGFLAAAGFS